MVGLGSGPATVAQYKLFLSASERAGPFCPVHRKRDAWPTFRTWRLGRSIRADASALGRAMVKESKFFRKQAHKAERVARAVSDAEISQSFLNMAKAYRSQADVLKAKKKSGKKPLTKSGLF
jgi:hypothetical protein